MCSLRISGPSILTALLTATLSLHAHAQSPRIQLGPASSSTQTTTPAPAPISSDPGNIAANKLPDAPGVHIASQQTPDQQSGGNIDGTVLDANGAEVAGAMVTLENTDSRVERTLTTDGAGSFKFESVEPGKFNLTITSTGFATWTSTDLALHTGQTYEIPPVELEIASATTSVEVTVTRHDIAEDQMHFEEKQRVFGVIPNFYVSYIWNAEPLSSGQKFHLAFTSSVDPVSIAIPAVIAGIEQWQNGFSGYGQGAQGYAKR